MDNEMIREKREAKTRDKKKYNKLKREVKKVREDKQKQIKGMCEELDESNKKGSMKQIFQTVKTLTKNFKQKLFCIK